MINDGKLVHTTYKGLGELQALVGGGSIELVPHKRGFKAPYVAYVNEEGLINDMPQNVLAAFVLDALGFVLCPPTFCIYGPVVIMKGGEKSLKEADRTRLEKVVADIMKEDL